jgi:hypothetical protein
VGSPGSPGASTRRRRTAPRRGRVDWTWRENRSAGPDLSRKQSGRREVPGVRVLFPPPSSWKLNRARREPGRYPVRAPSWAWCATHPASAPSLGVEFVNRFAAGCPAPRTTPRAATTPRSACTACRPTACCKQDTGRAYRTCSTRACSCIASDRAATVSRRTWGSESRPRRASSRDPRRAASSPCSKG